MNTAKESILQIFERLDYADQEAVASMLATYLNSPEDCRKLILENQSQFVQLFRDAARDIRYFEGP